MSHESAPEQHSPVAAAPTPGAILAAHRREAGLSVADVSDKLKLSKRQVEALEADEYGALPGNTFVRGFVRNYARLLGLDAQPLIQFLDGHLPKETSQAALPRLRDEALPVLRPGGTGSRIPTVLGALAGIAIVLGGIGGYWFYLQHGRFEPELTLKDAAEPEPVPTAPAQTANQEPVPAPVSETSTVPAPTVGDGAATADSSATAAATPVPTPAPATTAAVPTPAPASSAPVAVAPAPATAPAVATTAPAKPASSQATPAAQPPVASAPVSANAAAPAANADVRIVAKQDSWVQVTDSTGRRLVNQLLSAGETRNVGGTPPYKVRIGNGHQTELYYKGKPTDLTPYIKVDVANLELN